jgi:hypothetical protein
MHRSRKYIVATVILFTIVFWAFQPQEAKVNQSKINKEHRKKDKIAKKQHEEAIKMHKKNQSKETRAMMKKSKKESKKNTPMKAPGGKKCK